VHPVSLNKPDLLSDVELTYNYVLSNRNDTDNSRLFRKCKYNVYSLNKPHINALGFFQLFRS